MKEELFLFQLSQKLEYSKAGDFHNTATIELEPPSMNVFDESSALSQLVMRAVLDAREYADALGGGDQNVADRSDVDAAAIKMILMSSKNVKFSEVAEICKALFIKVGTYDGEKKLTLIAFKRMTIDDFVELCCGYIANFIWPSLFSTAGANPGETGDT